MTWRSRTEMVLGEEGTERLARAAVAVFGLGGVGSWAAEALARAGVSRLMLVDGDTVDETNINRQLVASRSTLGRNKSDVMALRVRDINPDACAISVPRFYTPESAQSFGIEGYDFIIDAIDMVTAKLHLICEAHRLEVDIISAMGTGNKLDPSRFEIADINATTVCPLARVIRRELKARGVSRHTVLYSKEEPITPRTGPGRTPGSLPYVPPVAGLMMAGHVIRRICGIEL